MNTTVQPQEIQQLTKDLVEALGYHFEDIPLSQIESIDLIGLPTKDTDENGWWLRCEI